VRGFFAVGVWEPKFGANMGTLMRSAYAFGAGYALTEAGLSALEVDDE